MSHQTHILSDNQSQRVCFISLAKKWTSIPPLSWPAVLSTPTILCSVIWNLSTDLAHGCLCDLCVCRHPVCVSCCHCQSADCIQRLGRLGWDPTLSKKGRVTLCHSSSVLTILDRLSLFSLFLLCCVSTYTPYHSATLHFSLHCHVSKNFFIPQLSLSVFTLFHLSSVYHFSSFLTTITLVYTVSFFISSFYLLLINHHTSIVLQTKCSPVSAASSSSMSWTWQAALPPLSCAG